MLAIQSPSTIALSAKETQEPPALSLSAPKKNRCTFCEKKLSLVNFSCRCGGTFCMTHRADVDHKCNQDFKKDGQNQLQSTLVKVTGQKIDKI